MLTMLARQETELESLTRHDNEPQSTSAELRGAGRSEPAEVHSPQGMSYGIRGSEE